MAELSGGEEGNKTRRTGEIQVEIYREKDEMSKRKQGWMMKKQLNNENNPKRKTEKNNERQKRGKMKERRKIITLYNEKI